jgi:hypothetical protein
MRLLQDLVQQALGEDRVGRQGVPLWS